MLILGNTVGANMLSLPSLANSVTPVTMNVIFFACFALNLVSGIVISELAINRANQQNNFEPVSFEVSFLYSITSHVRRSSQNNI
tara:strand:+ start:460 stop:714 length:255 start_codon:yes stop_codon:yes gene_type:complete